MDYGQKYADLRPLGFRADFFAVVADATIKVRCHTWHEILKEMFSRSVHIWTQLFIRHTQRHTPSPNLEHW